MSRRCVRMFSPKILRYFGIFTIRQGNSKPHIRTTAYTLYFVLAFFRAMSECCNVMNAPVEFRRRIGPTPLENGVQCAGCYECPDLWELANGDFAVIGEDITDAARAALPANAGCGSSERI